MDDNEYFDGMGYLLASAVRLPYPKFQSLFEKDGRLDVSMLCDEEREWLFEWRGWDLACSPMPDEERRFMRYGHWIGWHDAKDKMLNGLNYRT